MKRIVSYLLCGLIVGFSATAFAMPAVPVSPACDNGKAMVTHPCPTFSWSEADGAIGYVIEVFEAENDLRMEYEHLKNGSKPLLRAEIPGPALSWTPSSSQCLVNPGTYVWYVRAIIVIDGEESNWSYGERFMVDQGGLFPGNQEAVTQALKKSLENEEVATLLVEETALRVKDLIQLEESISSALCGDALYCNTTDPAFQVWNTFNGASLYGKNTGGGYAGFFEGPVNTTDEYRIDDKRALSANRINTFVGIEAGNSTTTGNYCTFLGYRAGYSANGPSNTFVGAEAGKSTTTALNNTFLGSMAGSLNVAGGNNTFIGNGAGYSNEGASYNTFVGSRSGERNTSGTNNTFIGHEAGDFNSTASYNTFVGHHAGFSNMTADSNTFVGERAGFSTTGGEYNTFVGREAGDSNLTGQNNTFFGYRAGYKNTANGNTFVGYGSGLNNTEGVYNTFLGLMSGYSNTSGKYNTCLGFYAGLSNMVGEANTYVGYRAGDENSGGRENTLIGFEAGATSTGSRNTNTGYRAGYQTAGQRNTFTGYEAGRGNESGSYNTFIGYRSGSHLTSGSGNTFLGYEAGSYETGSNKLYISNSDTDKPLIYGEFDNNLVKVYGTLHMTAAASPSDQRLKMNIRPLHASLEKVRKLQGVSYDWRVKEYPEQGFTERREVGLIAQDVEKVLPELVYTDMEGLKVLCYSKMVAVLVEAVKEQQQLIEKQKSLFETKLERQASQIKELRKKIQEMSTS